MKPSKRRTVVVGAGWAGCAAAVRAANAGHQVTLLEASRTLGGRARRVVIDTPEGPLALDNGQHMLIGAYTATLALMAELGVLASQSHAPAGQSMLRLPMTLRDAKGHGLALPQGPSPRLNALRGMLGAPGWTWADRLSLIGMAVKWEAARFKCASHLTVGQLCRSATPHLMASLIEPLCVSALNTPAYSASAQVFLRVLHDALFAQAGGSDYLLPQTDLSTLMPEAAAQHLTARGGVVRTGLRVERCERDGAYWRIHIHGDETGFDDAAFDQVVFACPPHEAARLCATHNPIWAQTTLALTFEAITTCYAWASQTDRHTATLPSPIIALRSDSANPAQFVFDRGQLRGPKGLLAFVVSASHGSAAEIETAVIAQAKEQLGLEQASVIQTIVEKRATFACTPGLLRPPARVTDGITAVGDYVAGPYPATLEGAVRSAWAVVV